MHGLVGLGSTDDPNGSRDRWAARLPDCLAPVASARPRTAQGPAALYLACRALIQRCGETPALAVVGAVVGAAAASFGRGAVVIGAAGATLRCAVVRAPAVTATMAASVPAAALVV